MKAPWTDPSLRELLALAALAAFGGGLALARDDLMFTTIFAAACAVTTVQGRHHRLGAAAAQVKEAATESACGSADAGCRRLQRR
jgi:hypothetical protein